VCPGKKWKTVLKGETEEMRKDMLNKSMLAAAGILVAASMAFAKSPKPDLSASSQKPAEVEIYSATPICGGPTLQPGIYTVAVSDNSKTTEIAFYQDGKLVVQVPAKLADPGKEFDDTSFNYDSTGAKLAMSEMDVKGWTERVLFGESNSGAGSTDSGSTNSGSANSGSTN
jgi:hypothetical protein